MQTMVLQELGFRLQPAAIVLDFGCGNGALVKAYRELGYEAFGCDLAYKPGPEVERLHRTGLIRLIERKPYRLPFPDESVDIVLSDQVFEHVKNYDETLAEMYRVLKPEGIGLHFFPSRYTLIEPHVYVPLATILQQRWWLAIWARLGVRAPRQQGMSVREVAQANHVYLTSQTNYLSKFAIERFVARYFGDYGFCESLFLKSSTRGRIIYQVSRMLPGLPWFYGMLRARVLFFRKVSIPVVSHNYAVDPPLTCSRDRALGPASARQELGLQPAGSFPNVQPRVQGWSGDAAAI
jgi:ubiquinone/menaquinone biosynthesis C-methylase UbiE